MNVQGNINDEESSMLTELLIPEYLRNSPLDIYNRTAENPILLPTKWNFRDCSRDVLVEKNQLVIEYIGRGTAAAIRSDHSIPAMAGIYYFEFDIIHSGPNKLIGIGFGGKGVSMHAQPGWSMSSIGYHGDDGLIFFETGYRGNSYGPLYSTGDTIGCCLNYYDETVFYTKNGINLGIASTRIFSGEMYPIVGMRNRPARIEVNFGARPFKYNIEYYAKTIFDESSCIDREIQGVSSLFYSGLNVTES